MSLESLNSELFQSLQDEESLQLVGGYIGPRQDTGMATTSMTLESTAAYDSKYDVKYDF